MDLDSDILSLIDGYVSSALGATGTKKAPAIHKPAEPFEGDTIPDVMSLVSVQLPQPPAPLPRERAPRASVPPHEDFDEIPTSVNNQQRLIR
jgi:hypothetical protein